MPERTASAYGLWHYVGKLLRLQWRIFISGFRHARLGRKIGYAMALLAVLAVLVVAFVASWALLSALRSPELATYVELSVLLSSVPSLITTIAFVAVFLFSFAVLLQALYLAGDMDFLLSSPVPARAVFVTKLLSAILPNLGLTLLLGLPVLFGLGAAGGYHPLYYPLVVTVLVAVVLAAAGLASLLVMTVARIFPARNVAEVLGVLGGLASLLCSQLNVITRAVGPPSSAGATQALGMLTGINAPWSPLAWAGRGLIDVGEGRWLTGAGFLLLTLGLAGALFAVALTTAERLYYTGWARVHVGTRRKPNTRARQPRTEQASPLSMVAKRMAPAAVRAVVVKDALVLRRDLRNMSQLLTPLMLGVVYAVMLIRGGGQAPPGRGEAPQWFMATLQNALAYGNIGISIFVGWSLLTRLAMMGFSQEGRAYWLLKTAPVGTTRLVAAKFLVAYLPALALSWAFLLAISLVQGLDVPALLFGMIVVALCIAGGAGLELALGVVGARLDWDDPRRMMTGGAGCLGFLVSAAYVIAILALFFGPPIGFALQGWPEAEGRLVGLALGGAASLACAIVPLRLVRHRVARIGDL